MKKISSKTAITLLELLIATAIVSVVLLGIYAMSNVLGNNSQDYGQRYLVKSDTQTTLNNILNNASLAVGSGILISGTAFLDQGIIMGRDPVYGWGEQFRPTSSICIHQQNPGDIWLCYTWFPSSDPHYPHQIYSCKMNYSISSPFRGAGSCIPTSSSFQFLGAAFSISEPTSPSFANTGNQMLFSMTITNCLDNTEGATCDGGGAGISSDPVNNPEVQLSGSVSPPQEGAQQAN